MNSLHFLCLDVYAVPRQLLADVFAFRLRRGATHYRLPLGLVVLALVAICPAASAQQSSAGWLLGFGENSAEELLQQAAQSLDAVADEGTDPDAVMLVRDLHISVDPEGRLQSTRRTVVHLLNQDGVDAWSEVSTQWSPWYEERPTVRARVVTEGADRLLSQDTLLERTAEDSEDIYGDRKVLQGPLPAVTVGAVIDMEIVQRETAPHFSAGSSFSFTLDSWFPIVAGSVAVHYPAESSVRAECRGLDRFDGEIQRSETAGIRSLNCSYKSPARGIAPFYRDQVELDVPRLAISTAADWNSVAAEYFRRIEKILADSEAVLSPGRAFEGDRANKVNQALGWMQERIRYTGLELGESSIIPYEPATVLDRGYGDCKDLATVLVGLLAQTGVPADLVLVRPGRDLDVDPDFPGLGRFSHVIVRVGGGKSVDDDIWVDPTSQYSAAGELPSGDQGRQVLVAHPETSGLITAPDLGAAANRVTEVRRIQMASYGGSSVEEVTRYTGDFAAGRRDSWSDYEEGSLVEQFEGYSESTYLTDKVEVGLVGLNERGRPLELTLSVDSSKRFAADLSVAVAALDPTTVLTFVPNSLFVTDDELGVEADDSEAGETGRVHYEFPDLHEYELHYVVTPPPGTELREVPEAMDVDFPGGNYRSSYEIADDGVVNARFVLSLNERRVDGEGFTLAAEALSELAVQDAILLWFDDEAATMMELGQAKESLELRQQLAQDHPDDVAIQARLASAWLGVGLRDAALAVADEAIARAEDSPLAHWLRGKVLSHGDTATAFGPGFDRDGAISSLRRAIDLAEATEEGADDYKVELSIVLEHDEQGVRYRGDLPAAAKLIEELAKSESPNGADTNYLINLSKQKKNKDIRAQWKDFPNTDIAPLIAMVATVADQGPGAGMRLLRTLGVSGAERSNLLARAAAELAEQGRFDEAEQLLRTAAPASGNAAAFLNRARLLESAASHAETYPEGSPQAIAAEALVESLIGAELDRERLTALFHPQAKSTVDDSLWEELLGTRTALVRAYSEAGQAMSAMTDASRTVFLAAFDVAVEGDDATGWKVDFSNSTAGEAPTSFLLAYEDQQPMLASWGSASSGAILIVRDFFDGGDFEKAKTWLDWVQDALDGSDGDGDSLGSWIETNVNGPSEDKDDQSSDVARADQDWLAVRLFSRLASYGHGEEAIEMLDRVEPFVEAQLAQRGVDGGASKLELYWSESLALAHLHTGDLEKFKQAFARAWQARPDAEALDGFEYNTALFFTLINAQSHEEALQVAQTMAEQEPDNSLAMNLLSSIALELGQLETAEIAVRRVLELTPGETSANNNLAWMLLFGEEPDLEEARRLAERGTARAGHANQAELHTLATVYAFSGDPQTALATIRQSLALHPKGQAEPHDWIVFGRIAEYFGQDEIATRFYERVLAEDDEPAIPANTAWLAQQRLSILQE